MNILGITKNAGLAISSHPNPLIAVRNFNSKIEGIGEEYFVSGIRKKTSEDEVLEVFQIEDKTDFENLVIEKSIIALERSLK